MIEHLRKNSLSIGTVGSSLLALLLSFSPNAECGPRFGLIGKQGSITRVGTATGTNSATIPTHAVGDLIIIFAYRDGSTTAPSLPAGYTSLGTKSGTTCGSRVGFKIATATNDTSGTWTNATEVVAAVYRATDGSIYVGNASSAAGTSNTLTYQANTLIETNGSSLVLGFAGHRSTDQNLNTAPSGMVNAASVVDATASAALAQSPKGLSSWGSTTVTLTGTASGWISWVVEIVLSNSVSGAWDIKNTGGIALGSSLPRNYSFTNSDRTLEQLTGSLGDVSSTDTQTSGKRYFEATFDRLSGTVGSVGTQSSSGYTYWDLIGGGLGTDLSDPAITGWAFSADGTIVGVAADLTAGKIWFKNISTNSNWNNSGTANPDTGTGGLSFTTGGTQYIIFGAGNGVLKMTLNTGDKGQFAGTIPSGFSSWTPSKETMTTIFLTSGTTWTVPSDWNSANNTVEVIGGGGNGYATGGVAGGGGGGAYSKSSNVTLTPNATVGIKVGGAAQDSYICNSTSNCAAINGTAVVTGAKGGVSATSGTGGAGGAAVSGVGDLKYSGGAGGTANGGDFDYGAGGGGAAGPNGNGARGGNATGAGSWSSGSGGGGSGGGTAGGDGTMTAGGNNFFGTGSGVGGAPPLGGLLGGGGGGGDSDQNGGAGGNGVEWTTKGAGGGGGGAGFGITFNNSGGNGGLYGGGGGGGVVSGPGAQGIIVIKYKP